MAISDSSTSQPRESGASHSNEVSRSDGQFGISDTAIANSNLSSTGNRKLYCFSCHRQESHYFALKGKAHYYLMVGMTFGFILLFGPYRCRCCGHKRLCKYNFLNIRYHIHRRKYTKSSSPVVVTKSSRSSATHSSDEYSETYEKEWSDDTDVKRKKKRRRLKSVPIVETIGKERREQRELEIVQQHQIGAADFTMDGLLSSFETEQSLRAKSAELRIDRPEFVARKAKPRKKLRGKPKRRHAKKTRLSGPTLYCFSCKQNNEHFHHLKASSFYSFFFGITLGLILLIGPYRCSVCSKRRLFGLNILHPKYYVRHLIEQLGEGYK